MADISKLNRVLIIRLSSLGDVLLTSPLVRSLKSKLPNLSIDYLVKPSYKLLLDENPYLSNIYVYDDKSKDLISTLKSNKYDLVIDLQNNFRSRIVTQYLPSKVVRFNKHTIKKFLLVKFKINLLKDAPQIPVRYANTVQKNLLDNKGLDLFIGKKDSLKIKNSVGIAPGAKHFTKRYPKEYYITIARNLIDQGYSVFLFGGDDEAEVCEEIKLEVPEAVNLYNPSLKQSLLELSQMEYLITNDSGLMHAGAAFGVKLIAIFGSSVKEFGFAPYKSESLILENNLLSCRPCSHIGRAECPLKHFKCMKDIKPEDVLEKIKSI